MFFTTIGTIERNRFMCENVLELLHGDTRRYTEIHGDTRRWLEISMFKKKCIQCYTDTVSVIVQSRLPRLMCTGQGRVRDRKIEL